MMLHATRHVSAIDTIDHPAIATLSAQRPVLLVCLRHLGCVFAREALRDLQARRAEIEASGVRLVLAHLEPQEVAQPWLQRFGLGDVAAISDPLGVVYDACGLGRGRWGQLLAPRVLRRWIAAALGTGLGASFTGADVRRMPGVFLVENGRIVRAYRHKTSADRPDYGAICSR